MAKAALYSGTDPCPLGWDIQMDDGDDDSSTFIYMRRDTTYKLDTNILIRKCSVVSATLAPSKLD